MDGTLLDTIGDLAAAVNHALALRNLPQHDIAAYRRMVGHGVRNLVTQALPEERQGDEAFIDACLADFRAFYSAHIADRTLPYPGMQELLRDLQARGVRLAVASNKFQAGTETLVRGLFPDIRFAAVLGDREGHPLKPDPEIVGEVLRACGCRRVEAVMVGDSPTDMKTAVNGGIDGIAVNWGYRQMAGETGFPVAGTSEALRELLALA
ncbi:MAG: HAD-IA family hydrolase [Bacteroidales bacterium]|nr:HAD-IA family hydrolase [Bacteroidales bacterium]